MPGKLIDYTKYKRGDVGQSVYVSKGLMVPQEQENKRLSKEVPRFNDIEQVNWIQRSADHVETSGEKVEFQMKIVPKSQRTTTRRYSAHKSPVRTTAKTSSIVQGICGRRRSSHGRRNAFCEIAGSETTLICGRRRSSHEQTSSFCDIEGCETTRICGRRRSSHERRSSFCETEGSETARGYGSMATK